MPTRNVLALPLSRAGADALRQIQSMTRAEAVSVMVDYPDCSWLRRAMAEPGTLIVSCGSFWLLAGAERWPCVAFWVTYRVRRSVLVYPSRRGGWACQTRENDALNWSQYAGDAGNRGRFWLDGEELTAPPPAPSPQTEPVPRDD